MPHSHNLISTPTTTHSTTTQHSISPLETQTKTSASITGASKPLHSIKSLTPFYQGHKNTTILRPVFEGQQVLWLKPRDVSSFNAENSSGVYSIDVKLSFKIRVRYGKFKTLRYKPPKIDCPLQVPLSSNGNSTNGFKTTWCDNAYFFSDPNADQLKIETNLVQGNVFI